jgi:hypothetical protein
MSDDKSLWKFDQLPQKCLRTQIHHSQANVQLDYCVCYHCRWVKWFFSFLDVRQECKAFTVCLPHPHLTDKICCLSISAITLSASGKLFYNRPSRLNFRGGWNVQLDCVRKSLGLCSAGWFLWLEYTSGFFGRIHQIILNLFHWPQIRMITLT